MDQDEMSILYRGSSIDPSYQVSVYLAKRFQRRRFFRNRTTRKLRNKNCLWWPCLLTDRNKKSNLYREPAMDSSNQVSVHLAKEFQRRRFLEIDQPETRIVYVSLVSCFLVFSIVNSRTISRDTQRGGRAR